LRRDAEVAGCGIEELNVCDSGADDLAEHGLDIPLGNEERAQTLQPRHGIEVGPE
jgi:hypothetical protein